MYLNQKKIVLTLVCATGMIAGWVYFYPAKPKSIETQTKPVQSNSIPAVAPRSFQKPTNKAPAEDTKDSLKIRFDVHQSASKLSQLFLDRIKMKKHFQSGDHSNPNQNNQFQNEMRPLKLELIHQLGTSPVARDEYVKAIQSESDPTIKSELLQVINKTSPVIQEEISLQLSASDNREDRIVAADVLTSIGTKNAIETLVQTTTEDPDPEVRKNSLEALARFHPKGSGPEWADSSSVIPTLKQFAQPQNDLKTRETAFRGLIAQPSLTHEDKMFIAEFAERETNPKLREMADAAQKTLSSR